MLMIFVQLQASDILCVGFAHLFLEKDNKKYFLNGS